MIDTLVAFHLAQLFTSDGHIMPVDINVWELLHKSIACCHILHVGLPLLHAGISTARDTTCTGFFVFGFFILDDLPAHLLGTLLEHLVTRARQVNLNFTR